MTKRDPTDGRFIVTIEDESYPWICHECGLQHGEPNNGISTHHMDTCGWCAKFTGVTHYRNYGWPKNPSKESKEP